MTTLRPDDIRSERDGVKSYIFEYRCRRCGAIFDHGLRAGTELARLRTLLAVATLGHCDYGVAALHLHNECRGVGEIIGWREEGE